MSIVRILNERDALIVGRTARSTHDARMPKTLGVILVSVALLVLSTTVLNTMFTLCMSRGHPSLQDATQNNRIEYKQIKGGYLLRYRRGLFCKGWSEEWVVLYEDSTLAWYADKGLSRPRGYIRIREAPDLLAVGEWTRQVPRRPRFPPACHVGQLLAVGSRTPHDVHWLIAQSPAEVNDWMTAISNTLPPPPHLPLNNQIAPNSLTKNPAIRLAHLNDISDSSRTSSTTDTSNSKNTARVFDADHTVLSGVVIDWGHGWGWGQAAWAVQSACGYEAAVNTTVYCHTVEDYALGGYDEMDWSAFGDFCF